MGVETMTGPEDWACCVGGGVDLEKLSSLPWASVILMALLFLVGRTKAEPWDGAAWLETGVCDCGG